MNIRGLEHTWVVLTALAILVYESRLGTLTNSERDLFGVITFALALAAFGATAFRAAKNPSVSAKALAGLALVLLLISALGLSL